MSRSSYQFVISDLVTVLDLYWWWLICFSCLDNPSVKFLLSLYELAFSATPPSFEKSKNENNIYDGYNSL